MSWFKNLKSAGGGRGQPAADYYREGAELLAGEQYLEALTSFRLALRRKPDDVDVLQQMAVAQTRLRTEDEAIRTYRKVLDIDPHAAGAHYGLAFLLMNRGSDDEAVAHLRAFLARPPEQADAHIAHARAALAELTGEATPYPDNHPG